MQINELHARKASPLNPLAELYVFETYHTNIPIGHCGFRIEPLTSRTFDDGLAPLGTHHTPGYQIWDR